MGPKVKSWAKFQHFKDRRPPWIKLYRDLLDDIEWHELDAEAAKVLVMLWLIASENDGALPPTKELAFRLRMSQKAVESAVSKLSHWLELSDNGVITERHPSDRLETERETETETEGETEICTEPQAAAVPVVRSPAVICLPLNTGAEYPVTEEQVAEWVGLYPSADVLGELRKMRGWLTANPARRKTKGGVGRFINAWLSKAHDEAKPGAQQSSYQTAADKRAHTIAVLTGRAPAAPEAGGQLFDGEARRVG